MEDDWDLFAVVRGCAAVASTTTTTSSSAAPAVAAASSSSSGSSNSISYSSVSSSCAGLGYPTFPILESKGLSLNSSIAQLHELCKPNNFFFPKCHLPNSFQPQTSSASSSFSYSSSSAPKLAQTHAHQKQQHLLHSKHSHAGSLTTPKSKRRKSQLKKVCQVPAESLSSDIWAWRKYGQKPIKGSPYPRGYYRCSSSKMCLARKQVERNRTDPTMFIVSYTAEHNHPAPTHRNALAGSTRQKPPITAAGHSDVDATKPISPVTSGAEEELASQCTTRSESKEDENEFGLSDIELTDDFFDGLDELRTSPSPSPSPAQTPTAAGDCLADRFSARIDSPVSVWMANHSSSAAGGT